MKRLFHHRAVLAWLLLLVSATTVAAADHHSSPQNVVLISWDGCDRSVFKELLGQDKLPNSAALIKEGSLQEIEVGSHETCTKPGHAEMLTGLDAKVSGVLSNSDYRPIPEGYTIFERVQRQLGGPEKIRTVMVAAKIDNLGGRSAEETGTKGEPYFLTRKKLDVFDAVTRDASANGPVCLQRLAECKSPRFLAFFHFAEPDRAGHKFGSASQEYRQATVVCDQWLGRIVDWLKQQNLYDQTLIYVTCDHGFDPDSTAHSQAPHVWLVTNDKGVTRGGLLADVPATILARFGVDLDKLEPKLVGRPLF